MNRSRLWIVATVVLSMSLVTSARASFIPNFTLLDEPDIMSGFILVNYDAGTGALTAEGFALEIETPAGTTSQITNGTFSLTAMIDQSSGSFLSGSISIGGTWSGFGTTLLTGSLVDFGFDPAGSTFLQFVFSTSGGDLAIPDYFGGAGSLFGVLLSLDMAHSGDWTVNYSNDQGGWGNAVADLAPIPAPGAGVLLLLAGCAARRRRR